MSDQSDIRPGEIAIDWPGAGDANLLFIGRIETPWRSRAECPRQGDESGPLCRITVFKTWLMALDALERHSRLEVIYWLHLARRDLVMQCARGDPRPRGTFALRSPVRPNPIGTSIVKLESIDGGALLVRGLDCVNDTPLLDLKPDRSSFNRGWGDLSNV